MPLNEQRAVAIHYGASLKPIFGRRVTVAKYSQPNPLRQQIAATRAEIYAYLLNACLTLTPADRTRLHRAYGLSDGEIDALRWRTIPDLRWLIVIESELQDRYGEGLRFAPGCYRDSAGYWRINLRPDGGLIVPRCDASGQVTRLRVVPHAKHDGFWLAAPDTGARLQREQEVLPYVP